MEKEKSTPQLLKCINCCKGAPYTVYPNYCAFCGRIFIKEGSTSSEMAEIVRDFWDERSELVTRLKGKEQVNEFGSTLRQLRQSMGLTQSQLAAQLNMTEANVSSYERGKSIPPTYILQMIGDIFDVSVDSLLGRTVEQEETTAGTVVVENPDVLISRYLIDQITGSPYDPLEFSSSKITVEFLMISSRKFGTGKHDRFLNDLKDFLDNKYRPKAPTH
jgi:transcriptional regulator with XRE-family HTH domain